MFRLLAHLALMSRGSMDNYAYPRTYILLCHSLCFVPGGRVRWNQREHVGGPASICAPLQREARQRTAVPAHGN